MEINGGRINTLVRESNFVCVISLAVFSVRVG